MKAFIKNITDDYQAIQQEYFKYLHAHPELSFEEHETSAYIQKQLQDMGIELLERFRKQPYFRISLSGMV